MRSAPFRYFSAVALVGGFLLTRLTLQPWLGSSFPYMHFVPPIVLAAYFGGMGPGMVAVSLSALAADYFLLPPMFSFRIAEATDRYSFPRFVVIAALAVVVIEWVRRSEAKFRAAAVEADTRAREGRDIANRLQEVSAAASSATERLTQVVANVPGVVWEAWGEPDAASQRIDFVSDHVEVMLGYAPSEWTSVPNFWLTVVHPDDKAKAGADARAIFDSGTIGRSEFRWVHRDGHVIWVEAYSSVILDAEKRPIGMRGVTLDVSDRKELEEERTLLLRHSNKVRAEAVEANRLKDDFLATLSHELRTPLNAILGYARMLRSGGINPDRHVRAIEIVERNATLLTQMVNDVLDVSRIITGKIRLNVQIVDLSSVLEEAVGTVKPAADAKGVRLQIVSDPNAGPISGDPDRLQQVIWNLLSNAVRFTPKGGRVQIRLERINSHVDLVVSDTGIGIAPEFLPHVFERFRQADSRFSREYGGLGLGLAITRELVELHGGSIRVISEGRDTGATFTISLPLMIVHADARQTDRVHPTVDQSRTLLPSVRLDGLRILIVDDDGDALMLMRDVLESEGASIFVADGAESALRVLATQVPDVMITDLGMPNADGFELLRLVRASASDAIRRMPVAALTAYARSEDRTRSLRAGFQMHLAKPIDPAELVAAASALAGRHTR